ncbi:Protein phosphatase 2C 37, partial [Mucuna pruriens]
MAGICCRVVGEAGETPTSIEPTSRISGRRSLDLLPLKYIADVAIPPPENSRKRQKLDKCVSPAQPRECKNAVESCESKGVEAVSLPTCSKFSRLDSTVVEECPRYGVTSVCGRRRDMEDAVSVRPSFCAQDQKEFHFFAVFDGHGCSHVATMCKERLHEILKEEVHKAKENLEWESMMKKCFARMDEEVQGWSQSNETSTCRCELQTPHCDAVGSTAVVAVITPEKIIVANCGDSRAVFCRNNTAIPLSVDHKPDRPDELLRIEAAGGRVIYWDGARVLGVLAMSRAIGDSYLKPYVISEPEVTITERSDADECLILGSDGLWDTVQNDTACKVVRMCLKAQKLPESPGRDLAVECSDKACSDASILLTKLALVRQSSDNVSVVVVDLRRDQPQPQLQKELIN